MISATKRSIGALRLVMGEIAPLEGTDEVICAGCHVLVHIGADRVRRASDDAEAGPTALPADATGGDAPTLQGTRAHPVVLVPEFVVAYDIRLKAIKGPDNNGIHPISRRRLHIPHIPHRGVGLL